MARQILDQAGNEQFSRFVQKLNEMFTELYGTTDAINAAAITTLAARVTALEGGTVAGETTTAALTTIAGATESLTITNAAITATSKVSVSIKNGTNTQGTPQLVTVTPTTGSAAVVVKNDHATDAFNGTLKLEYVVVNE